MTNHDRITDKKQATFGEKFQDLPTTTTVMVKVQDDILRANDGNKAVVLLMLDLSAAFDTVSHEILK